MKRICIGVMAHVDAGKTTLLEAMLYRGGATRRLGRVDHQDAFLDTDEQERARGITIFSKQAELALPEADITFLDTPGHVDFAAEMERTLQVLDYAILVVNGADGVQGHTETLWRLLARYQIPTFIFVNKMDQEGTDRKHLLEELKNGLGDQIMAFDVEKDTSFYENAAMGDDRALETLLELEKHPRPWRKNLYVDPSIYAQCGGWTFDKEGQRMQLNFDTCYPMVKGEPWLASRTKVLSTAFPTPPIFSANEREIIT